MLIVSSIVLSWSRKISCISLSLSREFASNLSTNLGVVFDALSNPQPSSKFTLNPSIVIFSPIPNWAFLINSSTILNFLFSSTFIFISGVEKAFGSSSKSVLIEEWENSNGKKD